MENIMKSIVMLIDMYYHRKKLMKRYKSIKHYQRTGIIDYKPSGLPISKNPPPPPIHSKSKYLKSVMDDLVAPQYISAAESAVKNKLVNSKEDYYQMLIRRQAEPKESEIYKLNSNILSYLNSVGAKANIIHNNYDMRDVLAIDVTYKNYLKRFEYSDCFYNHDVMQYTILDHIKVFIKQTDLKFEEYRKLLHKKNNPHSLKIGGRYLVRSRYSIETHFEGVVINRFTDLCFPWSNKLGGILSPDMYDIKTIDGKWIHNCKQWDEFQAKKKLNNDYQLDESDLKYLRDRGVQFSFRLSDVEGQHSVLKMVYKYKTETDIFYGKPLKADIFNSIMDFVKLVDRKEAMLGVMGTSAPW